MSLWASSAAPLRKIRGKYLVAAGLVSVLTVTMTSCMFTHSKSEAEQMVDKFATALANHDVDAAAQLTSYPNAAAASIKQMFDGLSAGGTSKSTFDVTQFIDLDKESGFFTLGTDWNFGKGKDWQYSGQGSAKKLSIGWRIAWDPSIVVPGLTPGGSIHYSRTDATPAPVVTDVDTNVMMTERVINSIELDPAAMPDPVASTTALANVIDVVAPLVTSDTLLEDLSTAGGKPITAVTLRDDDFAVLESDLRAIPGVVVQQQPKLISDDRRLVSPLQDAARTVWQASRDATAGWAIDLTSPSGTTTRQAGFQGPPPPPTSSTLDPKIQLAAEDAVVSAGTVASIVAIAPSTGAILAVAQNEQASAEGTPAFDALYPAGSAADMVRLVAAGQKGIDARDAAAQLGLGIHYTGTGFDATTATVPSGAAAIDGFTNAGFQTSSFSRTEKTQEMQVTPFGLAQMAATISRGSAPLPMIVAGQQATADHNVASMSSQIRDQLQATMTDSDLSDYPGLSGFAGESGADRWFIANQGDLAFAVYVENADGGDQAVRMTSRMMQALDQER